MSTQQFTNGERESMLSESELKEKADTLYNNSSLSDPQVDLQEYRKQQQKEQEDKYKSSTSLVDRVQDSILKAFGRTEASLRQKEFTKLKTQNKVFDNQIKKLQKEYELAADQYSIIQQEISKLDHFVEASTNLYQTLLNKQNTLKTEIQMIHEGEGDTSLYTLHQKQDKLIGIKKELLERHRKTDEGMHVLQSSMLERDLLKKTMDMYSASIAEGNRQLVEAKMTVSNYELFERFGRDSPDGLAMQYENLGVSIQKLRESGVPGQISEMRFDTTYRAGNDKSLPSTPAIDKWKNMPPPQ